MILESLTGGINIKSLVLEEARPKINLCFDLEKEITENDYNRIVSQLRVTYNMGPLNSFLEFAQDLVLLFPQRVADFKLNEMLDQNILDQTIDQFAESRIVGGESRDNGVTELDLILIIPYLKMAGFGPAAKRIEQETIIAYGSDYSSFLKPWFKEWKEALPNLRNSGNAPGYGYDIAGGIDPFQAGALAKIYDIDAFNSPHGIGRFFDKEVWGVLKDRIEFNKVYHNFPNYVISTGLARILYPEESKTLPVWQIEPEDKNQFLEYLKKEGDLAPYCSIAAYMKILAAENIKITTQGLELTMIKEKPDFTVNTPSLPERRRF